MAVRSCDKVVVVVAAHECKVEVERDWRIYLISSLRPSSFDTYYPKERSVLEELGAFPRYVLVKLLFI